MGQRDSPSDMRKSGKTTAMTAVIALAADEGYRVIIALLGSTNLLLDQNESRLIEALVGDREDYRWVSIANPGASKGKDIRNWVVDRGRTVFIPVLKHAGRINNVAAALRAAGLVDQPVLVLDDEADQASLNAQVNRGQQSLTDEAISALRSAVPRHLYVQFTATPYAPLLLEPHDTLRPDFVELLHPGPGYTGGREFFVDSAHIVVRPIPTLDEQPPRSLPTQLQKSLVQAFASFVAGTAILLNSDATSPPISMMVHSTQRNDVQARHPFLLQRLVRKWTAAATGSGGRHDLPTEIGNERSRLVQIGVTDVDDTAFLNQVRYVLRDTAPARQFGQRCQED